MVLKHNSKTFTKFGVFLLMGLMMAACSEENDIVIPEPEPEPIPEPLPDPEPGEEDSVDSIKVPTLYITLSDYPDLNELGDKRTYLNAIISIDGSNLCEDVDSLECTIKGRGNSSWSYPKKPYRLKFSTKTSILGFEKQKSYVLLANYIDCTLMRNAIAFKAAQLLGMPYTNHVVPIRLYLNGNFKGAYMATEKVGISKTSVNIKEKEGILWELDSYYDEEYKFKSAIYQLPVMVKDPDLSDIAPSLGYSDTEMLSLWQADFEAFEQKAYNDEAVNGVDYDLVSLVDYIIVYNLCGNREFQHPKSTYLYKPSLDSPYYFGPVWDFDWAFTYNSGNVAEWFPPEWTLASSKSSSPGNLFFKKFFISDEFQNLYAKRWQTFVDDLWPQLCNYIDEYADMIEISAIENGQFWPATPKTLGSYDFRTHVEELKVWLNARVAYISSAANFGLY